MRVRQAISHAIDRQALAKSLYFGHAVATYGPIAPERGSGTTRASSSSTSSTSTKAARCSTPPAGRSGSGGVREKNGNKLSWTHLGDSGQPTTSPVIDEAVVAMLQKVGIDMKLKVVDDATFNAAVYGGKNPPASWSYEWLWSSPIDLLVYFHVVPSDAYNGAIPSIKAACKAWQSGAEHRRHGKAASQLQLAWAQYLPKIPMLTTQHVSPSTRRSWATTPLQTMLYPLYNDVWINS